MPMRRLRQLRSTEEGFALIEVLISSLIVVMVTAAVVQTLTATGRASTDQRHRSQAFSVAQEDQDRLRGMRISTLQQGLAPRTVTVDGATFTVTSTATYVSDKTGTTKCGGEGRADYVRLGSSVTWPTMREGQEPIKLESIMSPTSGSVSASSGGLAVTVRKSSGFFSGFSLSGSGPATFSGSTNYEGCALFGGEPTGEYTITPIPPGPGYVDVNGVAPKAFPTNISGGTTTAKELIYDLGGALKVQFQVLGEEGTLVAAKSDSIVTTNPGMSAARTFGAPGTGMQTMVEGKPLFPFSSGYSVYAGSCTPAVPALQPEAAAEKFVTVPAGGSAEALVRMPALYLNVRRSSGGTLAEQTAVSGARVTLTDLNCVNSSKEPIKRVYKTRANGSLGENSALIPTVEMPGVPTGEYKICASKGGQMITATQIVKSVNGTKLTLDLASAAATAGECP